MLRADAVRAVGGYRAACDGAEDYDLWLRLAECGGVDILHEPLVSYRVHASSVSRQKAVRQCFAARLARISAAERLAGRADPLDGWTSPPDWWSADERLKAFEAAVRLCRILDFAAPMPPDTSQIDGLQLPDWQALGRPTHLEKVQLRRAFANLLRARRRPSALRRIDLVRELVVSLLR
jgi:hypothetical protein